MQQFHNNFFLRSFFFPFRAIYYYYTFYEITSSFDLSSIAIIYAHKTCNDKRKTCIAYENTNKYRVYFLTSFIIM